MQTLQRTLRLVDALAASSDGFGVREISTELDLPKSAVGRILKVLLEAGYAAQDDVTHRYVLGPKAAILGHAYASKLDFLKVARPVMAQLCETTGETVSLNLRVQHTRICIAQVESTQELRAVGVVGQTYPLDSGAPGRVLLSALDDAEIQQVLVHREELRSYAPFRPMSNAALLKSIGEIRRTGLAIANQETMSGVCSLAVPLRNHVGSVVAAMGILVPYPRFDNALRASLESALRAAAGEIERALGFSSRLRPGSDSSGNLGGRAAAKRDGERKNKRRAAGTGSRASTA